MSGDVLRGCAPLPFRQRIRRRRWLADVRVIAVAGALGALIGLAAASVLWLSIFFAR